MAVYATTNDGKIDGKVPIELPGRSYWLHPITVCSIVWLGIVFLFSLRLSYILTAPLSTVVLTVLEIWGSFCIAALATSAFALPSASSQVVRPSIAQKLWLDQTTLERRLKLAFRIWLFLTIIEVIKGRGTPLIWALLHNGKIYTEFGITTIHGLVDSLLLATGLGHLLLALRSGRRRNYYYAFFVPLWAMIIINRNMLLVCLLQYIVLFMCMRSVKKATVMRAVALGIAFVLIFGIVGDIRQPEGGSIRILAQPTNRFPEWLPSGILWAYIYAASPVENLVYNMKVMAPRYDLRFPNTASTLFPTVIRNVLYGEAGEDDAVSGYLEVVAFNTSTAFTSPFEDFGVVGVIALSMLLGIICELSWLKGGIGATLIFAVLTQCLVLTVFFNHFFDLPVITQVIWIALFFKSTPFASPIYNGYTPYERRLG